jgi:hypothetical protein
MLLMSGNDRDAMSPRKISVAMAPPQRPRLLPGPESGRRSPRFSTIYPPLSFLTLCYLAS